MGVIEIHLDTGYTNGNGTERKDLLHNSGYANGDGTERADLLHDGGYANGDGMGQEHLQLNS